jgi:putative membrane protein
MKRRNLASVYQARKKMEPIFGPAPRFAGAVNIRDFCETKARPRRSPILPQGRAIMLAMLVRQSLKFIILAYIACTAAGLAVVVSYYVWKLDQVPLWAPLLPFLAIDLLITIRLLRALTTKLTVLEDRLRWESGMVSKATRTIELDKIQDVRVDQTLGQRILGVGNLSLETAGGSSKIVMRTIDRPQPAADRILELARDWRNKAPRL